MRRGCVVTPPGTCATASLLFFSHKGPHARTFSHKKIGYLQSYCDFAQVNLVVLYLKLFSNAGLEILFFEHLPFGQVLPKNYLPETSITCPVRASTMNKSTCPKVYSYIQIGIILPQNAMMEGNMCSIKCYLDISARFYLPF